MDLRVHDAALDSLQLSNFNKKLFTPEQIEAIAKAIEAAIDAHKQSNHS